MAKREHVYERRVRLLQERIDASIERMKDFLRTDGRPMFFQQLTQEEELKAYLDPNARIMLMRNKLLVDGPEKYYTWLQDMESRVQALLQGG